ncbi:tunicamycin resistance protein [Hanseniaspora vineae]
MQGIVAPLSVSVVSSALGYAATKWLIPRVSDSFIKIGLFGKDLSKVGKPVIPETIGAIPSVIFILLMFINIPFFFFKDLTDSTLFPYGKFSEFLSAILCLESILLLGIADDLFDLRWRHKFFLPAFAAIPLLVVYYVDFGGTTVMIPPFIQNFFELPHNYLDLKGLYYCYMASVAIFCPNSINILAGVNGLEVGQVVVLCVIFLLNDFLFLFGAVDPAKHSHILSSTLIIQLLGCSLALYHYNKFPARVFVGDTFCYFAGMVFAVCGILGHFSKTTLLFFIPQIFNFAYSAPQLVKLVPCPRHRMPKFNEKDGLLHTSRAVLGKSTKDHRFDFVLRLLYKVGLIDLEFEANDEKTIVSCSNMTLINLVLVWSGPLREDKLCQRILILQLAIGILAIVGRHLGGAMLFGHDNLFSVI